MYNIGVKERRGEEVAQEFIADVIFVPRAHGAKE